MPSIILQTVQNAPLLAEWYDWGVFLSFLVGLAATGWIFADAYRSGQDAVEWKSVAAVATVLSIPALLARLHAGFAADMRDSLVLVGYLSIVAALLALVAAAAHATLREQLPRCPICGQPQQAGWTKCPYHPEPIQAIESSTNSQADRLTIENRVEVETETATQTEKEKELIVASDPTRIPGSPSNFGRDAMPGETVILNREPPALAYLVFTSGPHTGNTLPLKAEVTKIGRDGRLNDYAIDDEAVSSLHLSIRHQNGEFWLTDLDSANGTMVNNKRIQAKHPLQKEERILIGRTELVFMQVPKPKTDDAPAE